MLGICRIRKTDDRESVEREGGRFEEVEKGLVGEISLMEGGEETKERE